MSLVDAEPVPSRVLGVIRTAALRPSGLPWKRDDLEDAVAPRSLRGKSGMGLKVIEVCVELGLLARDTEGRLEVTVEGRKAVADSNPEAVRWLLLRSVVADAEFSRFIAWVLMQPIAEFPMNLSRFVELQSRQDPEKKLFKMSNVVDGTCVLWMSYLGLGSIVRMQGWSVLGDPTRCLEAHLDALCGGRYGEQLPLVDVIQYAEEWFPFLEGGAVAREVRAALTGSTVRLPGRLNETTSLALLRLEQQGILKLLSLSDAKHPAILALGTSERIVSHIVQNAREAHV